jgi:hypothetical protein
MRKLSTVQLRTIRFMVWAIAMLIAETFAMNRGLRNAAAVPAIFMAVMVPAVILPLEKRKKS